MAQESLARAFVSLGLLAEAPENPRAWLFRVASNLWINRTRKARELPDRVRLRTSRADRRSGAASHS